MSFFLYLMIFYDIILLIDMKKIIIWFISILIILFLLIMYMNINNNKYNDKLENNIINNTEIKKIRYIKKYDNYYIVTNNKYIYLIDSKYDIILKKDISLIHKNTNNYDIIYKDEYLMYFNDYIKDDILVYEYYDINTYELIDRVFVGGKNE